MVDRAEYKRRQAPPGAAAAAEGVRPRPAHADHEPLAAARSRRRSAPGGGPSSSSARVKRGKPSRDELLARLLELVERPPAEARDTLRGEVDARLGLVLVDSHEVDALVLAQDPAGPSERVRRAARSPGRGRSRSRPASSASSRRSVCLARSRPRRRLRPVSPTTSGRCGRGTRRGVRGRRGRGRARAPLRARRARARRGARRTSAAARPTERLRSRATSTAARRDRRRENVRSCGPSSGRSLNTPRYASLPTNAIARGRSSRARRSSRSAEPAKSARRRSPEPGVVRYAAFVTPTPSSSSANCSLGSNRRGVKPAACSSRQKSLRGFAKCARGGGGDAARIDPAEDDVEVRARARPERRPIRWNLSQIRHTRVRFSPLCSQWVVGWGAPRGSAPRSARRSAAQE